MYGQLGRIEGPSVVKTVVLAFLLPPVVFIASLAVFEQVLRAVASVGPTRSVLSFASALLLTFICMLFAKAIDRRFSR